MEQFTFDENSNEQKKIKFLYIDNSKYPDTSVVFECTANDINEADEQYKAYTGLDVTKQPHIGCVSEIPGQETED